MDYLDHNKELRQRVLLFVGYVLVGFAVVIAAIILLYQSYGFGVNDKGDVIQNGLTFFSSHPNPADIYVNGQLKNSKTNTRLVLPSGLYDVKLTRTGYHDWQRAIEVNGGDVQHFDYPFLFPKTLSTSKIQSFAAAPNLITQSPDHRWVLIQAGPNLQEFSMYDLKSPEKPPTTLSLPANILTKASTTESWLIEEWADDNRHVVLQHNFDGKVEFILLDRETITQSINLNVVLNVSPSKLTLNDKKYDKYYIYDAPSHNLQKTTLQNTSLLAVQQHVLAYKTYSDDMVLYVTDLGSQTGKVSAKLMVGDKTYNIRSLSLSPNYSVDLTKYDGVMYVVVGAANDNRAYVYKDPVGQIESQPKQPLGTTQVLRVPQLNFVSFSPTAQYIMAENGNRFGVYDIENKSGYNYTTKDQIDSPQVHASWMDGNRLVYVSGGKLNVFDYDYTNLQVLMPASSSFLPAFSPDYKYVYALTSTPSSAVDFDQTSLRTPADR